MCLRVYLIPHTLELNLCWTHRVRPDWLAVTFASRRLQIVFLRIGSEAALGEA